MLFLFDLDGTLIRSFIGDDGERHLYEEVVVLPGRRERLNDLLAWADDVAVVTNQGGCAFGYQSPGEVSRKLVAANVALGLDTPTWRPIYVCVNHPAATVPKFRLDDERRKPKPGMLLEAMKDARYAPEDTLYVGDMDTDRKAAEAAGVRFEWAEEFFE